MPWPSARCRRSVPSWTWLAAKPASSRSPASKVVRPGPVRNRLLQLPGKRSTGAPAKNDGRDEDDHLDRLADVAALVDRAPQAVDDVLDAARDRARGNGVGEAGHRVGVAVEDAGGAMDRRGGLGRVAGGVRLDDVERGRQDRRGEVVDHDGGPALRHRLAVAHAQLDVAALVEAVERRVVVQDRRRAGRVVEEAARAAVGGDDPLEGDRVAVRVVGERAVELDRGHLAGALEEGRRARVANGRLVGRTRRWTCRRRRRRCSWSRAGLGPRPSTPSRRRAVSKRVFWIAGFMGLGLLEMA